MSQFSVKKPLTIFVAVVLIIILGIVSFTNMSTDLLPSMDLPYVAIMATSVGDSPEKIEKNVTKPLERQLATAKGIKNIQSISAENMGIVIMEFYDDTDMNSVMIELSSKIDLANLDDSIPNPTILQINPDMMPVFVGAIDQEGKSINELSSLANDEIIPSLERVDGVASVTTNGLVENSISVSLNQNKINELNEKVLSQVDSTLADTKKKLNDGSIQLIQAKEQLRQQESKQTSQLVSGEIQLTNAINTLNMSLQSINSSMSAMDTTIMGIQQKITEAQGQLEILEKNGQDTTQLQDTITKLKTSLKESQSAKDTLNNQKKELESQLISLNEKSSSLAVNKDKMAEEIAKAYRQIEEGEAQILKGQIAFDNASQSAYQAAGLTSALNKTSINQILQAQNFSMPAGYIDVDNVATVVKVGDEFQSIDEIKNLVLVDQESIGTIYLKDVADIKEINQIDGSYAKINGNDGLLLSIQKQSTASTAKISDDLSSAIKELEKQYDGLHITSLQDQGKYIDIIINSVLNNLVIGGLLAAIILYLFLRNLKTTLITAVSIPISLMFAVVLMYFSGVSLNIISLSGLALGVGMLVDNSIVVIENIYRLNSTGMAIKEAAVKGAKQMAGAITSSTLTTICVFLPIVFTEGLTKQLFVDMGLTIGYSLIASLIIALTLVPAMSSKMMKQEKQKSIKLFDKIVQKYSFLLNKILDKKIMLFTFVIALFLFSCYEITQMGTAFIPEMDSNNITVTIKGNEELEDEEFEQKVDDATKKVKEIEGVDTVGVMQGGSVLSSMGKSSGHSMTMYIILDENRNETSQEIASQINQLKVSNDIVLEASGSSMDMSMLTGSGIQIDIQGQDINKLIELSEKLKNQLQEVEGINEVTNGLEDSDKEIVITVDKNEAMKYQLTVAQVYAEIAGLLKTDIDSTKLTLTDGKEYPVVISDSQNQITLEDIQNHEITVNNKNVKIKDIADIRTQSTVKSISHKQQTRTISVTATLKDGENIGLVSRQTKKIIDKFELPAGYTLIEEGEIETINNALFDLVKMIALAILFIYLIMVAQFQSLKSPFIVLFTLPLAFTGGLLALLLTGSDLSLIAMLGFLILSGVVVNNGIVFVDCINQLKAQGYEQRKAIIMTGQMRIRPILMTALTTILGLSTMALGMGTGADMLAPMAIVTIGGLVYSTLLTLFVVPSIYDLLNKNKKKEA